MAAFGLGLGTCGARADTAVTWGYNGLGELGNGTTTSSNVPVTVSGLSSGVTAIGAGSEHSLAIQNGAVYAWGLDSNGEVGNGTTTGFHTGITTPVAVSGLTSGVTAVAGGDIFSLALRNGGVYAWGSNGNGTLGNGSSSDSNVPVAVTGLSSGVTAIDAGWGDGLAIQNGGVYVWGYDEDGELGNGTRNNMSNVPVTVSGLSSATAIAGGDHTSLAIQNGGVYGWGYNNEGELGDGTRASHTTPEQIDPTDLKNIVAIAEAGESSYALSSDGSLWVWGDNTYGELGLGTSTTDYLTPQHLLPPSGEVFTSIETNAGGIHAVATLAAVPEPTCTGLMALSAVALLRRRGAR